MKNGQFLVLLYDAGKDAFYDSGEGPFRTWAGAVDFARHEVGVQWIVCEVVAIEGLVTK